MSEFIVSAATLLLVLVASGMARILFRWAVRPLGLSPSEAQAAAAGLRRLRRRNRMMAISLVVGVGGAAAVATIAGDPAGAWVLTAVACVVLGWVGVRPDAALLGRQAPQAVTGADLAPRTARTYGPVAGLTLPLATGVILVTFLAVCGAVGAVHGPLNKGGTMIVLRYQHQVVSAGPFPGLAYGIALTAMAILIMCLTAWAYLRVARYPVPQEVSLRAADAAARRATMRLVIEVSSLVMVLFLGWVASLAGESFGALAGSLESATDLEMVAGWEVTSVLSAAFQAVGLLLMLGAVVLGVMAVADAWRHPRVSPQLAAQELAA